MTRLPSLLLALSIGLALVGCGQKAPLYLERPEPAPPPAVAPKKAAQPAAPVNPTPTQPGQH